MFQDLLNNAFGQSSLVDLLRINLSSNMQSKLDFILNEVKYSHKHITHRVKTF